LLASQITGTLAPTTIEIAEAVHPTRFLLRDLKRNARL